MDYRKELDELLRVEDPLRRKARFMGILSREVLRESGKTPVIVGRFAVEVFTVGRYTSLDVDVKGPKESITRILGEMGFRHDGTHFVHEGLDIFIQWLGEGPSPLSESLERLVNVPVDHAAGLFIRLIGFEDLIIDRLNQAKHWKVADAGMWAARILEAALTGEDVSLDFDYLRQRAEAEDVMDVLDDLLSDVNIIPEPGA